MAERPDSLQFWGAVGTVTGSRFLLTVAGQRILVDCGLFQGYKKLRLRNWRGLPIAPSELDLVVLTHAHLDHSGYLPVICRDGYRGSVLCTPATRDLCRYLLPDSGFIQENDAARANRYGYTRHHPARPLYTKQEAEACLIRLRSLDFAKTRALGDRLSLTFRRAGHIPGAASALFETPGCRILFSGDLGPPDSATMPPPERPPPIDVLVVESTYGDRRRNRSDPEEALADAINRTLARAGSVIIPAFAVGRTQLILHHLRRLIDAKRIARVPVYLDSPLAINATEVFANHPRDHRLSPAEAEAACALPNYVYDAEGSKALGRDPTPKIIIAGSGMATGGRVVHHLKVYAPEARNTIVFAGFQAGGTRGAALVAGAKKIKIHGQYWPVEAEVVNLEMLSAHADCDELIDWLSALEKAPRSVFIVHGEPSASDGLRTRIRDCFGWDAVIPEMNEVYRL